MTRWVVVALALVIAMGVIGAGWAGASVAPNAQGGVRSGGIGLSWEDWEQRHGVGEVGQTLVTYEGGTYAVGFSDDVVTFIEQGWEDQGGITPQEATEIVEDLLPRDARLLERYYAPATAAGPTSLLMERYDSRGLEDLLEEGDGDGTGSILVLYQETPVEGRFEPNVARVDIMVGEAP